MSPDGSTDAPRASVDPALRFDPNGPIKLTDIFVQGTRLLARKEGSLRIGLIGSVTTDLLARAVALGASHEGAEPVIYQATFGTWRQEALDPGAALHRFRADIVVVATDWRDLVDELPLGLAADEVEAVVARKVAGFRGVWDAILRGAPACRIVQHLPAASVEAPGGVADLRVAASRRRQLTLAREKLLASGPDVVFLDLDGLPADAAAWYGAKLPFAQDGLVDYLLRFRSAMRQGSGRVKKVLALDLDNTLWGGVIGDDGLDGLVLGAETPRGEAFAAFQSYAKDLAARGIVLAVCSKNDPEIATTGFTHAGSVLKRDDFAAFECNWTDKASALRRIARSLNLGTDSIVFCDDNPVECALVREAVPEVTVVELGDDPAQFIARLARGRWFEMQHLGAEDLARSQAYAARAEAAAAMEEAPDLDSFLAGLDMKGHVFVAEGKEIARIAQLEGKTNQFNLTLRRHPLAVVEGFAASDDAIVLGATLSDKFGDHGLVSSVVALVEGDALVIDSWLMSCRVFSRTLEQFVMRHLIGMAAERGLARIVGLYVAGPKNDVVADLYPRLGFAADGDGRWVREVAAPVDGLQSFIAAPV